MSQKNRKKSPAQRHQIDDLLRTAIAHVIDQLGLSLSVTPVDDGTFQLFVIDPDQSVILWNHVWPSWRAVIRDLSGGASPDGWGDVPAARALALYEVMQAAKDRADAAEHLAATVIAAAALKSGGEGQ